MIQENKSVLRQESEPNQTASSWISVCFPGGGAGVGGRTRNKEEQ